MKKIKKINGYGSLEYVLILALILLFAVYILLIVKGKSTVSIPVKKPLDLIESFFGESMIPPKENEPPQDCLFITENNSMLVWTDNKDLKIFNDEIINSKIIKEFLMDQKSEENLYIYKKGTTDNLEDFNILNICYDAISAKIYFNIFDEMENERHSINVAKTDFFDGEKVIQVSTGRDDSSTNSIALTESGNLWSWGTNWAGETGLGHDMEVLFPQKVMNFVNKDGNLITEDIYFKEVSVGVTESIALSTDGKVFQWGLIYGLGDLSFWQDKPGFICGPGYCDPSLPVEVPYFANNNIKAVKVQTGSNNFFVIDENGVLYSWGANWYGEAGLFKSENPIHLPEVIDRYIDKDGINTPLPPIKNIVSAGGNSFAFSDDKLFVWGNNHYGQHGTGDTQGKDGPHEFVFFKEQNIDIKKISVGDTNVLFLTETGEVYFAGEEKISYVEHIEPIRIKASEDVSNEDKVKVGENYYLSNIKDIAAGTLHYLIQSNSGRIYAQGFEVRQNFAANNRPENSLGLHHVSFFIDNLVAPNEIEAGRLSIAIINGRVYTWGGSNNYGQLGQGDKKPRHSPKSIR